MFVNRMLATKSPYDEDSDEHYAWCQGYDNRTFLSSDEKLTRIYDEGRLAARSTSTSGLTTDVKHELRGGHMFYVLYVNDQEVFKSMMPSITDALKEKLDRALAVL